MPSPHQALKALTQDPDFAHLETLLQRFNLFEAVGVLRQELRHSDLLATFLDPRQSHGLGTLFLTELLRVVAPKLDTPNLRHAWAEREWHNVDILIVDDTRRFAIIIENKIDTAEHSDQLSRYYADVRSHFPEYAILALYLTPDGDAPSDRRYRAVSYSQVCQILEMIVAERHETLDIDIIVVLRHYAQMLRRHIVSDSDVAKLCREIYQKHKHAMDLIIKHRIDKQAEICQYVKMLLSQTSGLNAGYSAKDSIVFSLPEWHNSVRHGGNAENNICWIMYFGFANDATSLSLELKIGSRLGPGTEAERQKHLEMAQKNLLTGYRPQLSAGRSSVIASVSFLNANDYDKTQEEIEAIISEKWEAYLRDELPRIKQAVRDEKWLWELPA